MKYGLDFMIVFSLLMETMQVEVEIATSNLDLEMIVFLHEPTAVFNLGLTILCYSHRNMYGFYVAQARRADIFCTSSSKLKKSQHEMRGDFNLLL